MATTNPTPALPQSLAKAQPTIKRLWSERIASLDFLRARCEKPTSLVMLDIEGSEGQASGITGIGVAIVNHPDLSINTSQACAATLEALSADLKLANLTKVHGIKAHNFACGARSAQRGRYKRSPLATIHWIDKATLNQAMDDILQDTLLQGRDSSILVVWGGNSEFQAMSSTVPCLANRASQWMDLSNIVGDLSSTRKRPYSLRDVMLSLGFLPGDVQSRKGGHSAGMDAVRTAGLLFALCQRQGADGTQPLALRRYILEELETRKFWEERPPPETFPHAVILTTPKNRMPPSISANERLYDYMAAHFGDLVPSAVAVLPCTKSRRPRKHAWLCFPDRQSLLQFMEEMKGVEVDGQPLLVCMPTQRCKVAAQANGASEKLPSTPPRQQQD